MSCHPRNRHGNILILTAVLLSVFFALIALSVDLGLICLERGRCQNAADAASHACADWMLVNGTDPSSFSEAREVAIDYAELNMPNANTVLAESDIVFGVWDAGSRTFTEASSSVNAVQVVVRRSEENGNPLSLFFARIMGQSTASVAAEAVTVIPLSEGASFKFLLDDEMFDSDVSTIEDLADLYGVTSEEIISDADGDGYIDMPPGTIIELPTGQVGDEGMFNRLSYEDAFPFTSTSTYTTLDFLAEGTALQNILGTQTLQDVEWYAQNAPHPDLEGNKVLDPIPGVDPMDCHQDILDLPDPHAEYVSPLFKSDVSMAETDPSVYGAPAANMQGERRGLVAFKILSARSNPAGGSYLPLVTIEILDPSTIDLLNLSSGGSGSGGNSRPVIVQ